MFRTFSIAIGKRFSGLITAHRTAASLQKDVLLYQYENTKFFRYLNLFGVSQFVFWTYLSNFATSLRDVPVTPNPVENRPWYERLSFLGENKYRNGMAILFFAIGKDLRSKLPLGFFTGISLSRLWHD